MKLLILGVLMMATSAFAGDYSGTRIVVDASGVAHGTGYIQSHDDYSSRVHVLDDESTPIPASYDLRALGFVSPIKDQGQCGSCWAHATTESLEDAILRAGKAGLQLSVQEMTSCNSAQDGCNGGEMNAADFLVTPGLALDSALPYQGVDMQCPAGLTVAAKATSWAYVGKSGVAPTTAQIQRAILKHGSIFVTVAAGGVDWNGQATMTDCTGTGLDHMVEIVGWTTAGQWIMRNSWGTGWGDHGFAYMPYGCDEIATDPDSAAYTVL